MEIESIVGNGMSTFAIADSEVRRRYRLRRTTGAIRDRGKVRRAITSIEAAR